MDKVGKKMVSKRSCCIIQLFFVLCRHLSQRWCNFVDKIIKDGTLGWVSRSCEIWRSPQEFLPKVWRLTQFFLLLRVGMAAAVTAVADNARMSCRHEQANRFCKLKSGKLKRRKNANLFERVYTVIGVDSSFAFSFLRVLPEPNLQGSEESRGSHLLFSLMNYYELVWFTTIQYLCNW